MTKYPNDDSWKDDFLARQGVTIAEFNALPAEQKTWLLEHRNIFYNVGTDGFLNLLHKRNKALNDKIKSSSSQRIR